MTRTPPTIWLQSSRGIGSCATGCIQTGDTPPCLGHASSDPCPNPDLRGDATLLAQALRRLDQVVEPGTGRGLVELQWIKALTIADGEAELTVTFGAHCEQGLQLSDEAFHALAAALPETDVYVRHLA